MPVDATGVTIAGSSGNTTISWDDFNGLAPAQQKQILTTAGVPTHFIAPMLEALQKTEMAQFSQYQGDQAYKKATSPKGVAGWGPIGAVNRGIEGVIGDIAGSYNGVDKPHDRSVADLQQQSGLSDLLKQAGIQTAVSGATSAAAAKSNPFAYSKSALDNYTNNYAIPMGNWLNSQVAAEDSAATSALASIAKNTGTAGSPLSNIVNAEEKVLNPQMLKLMDQTYGVNALKPYYNAINQTIANQAAEGVKAQQQGALYQTLLQQQGINSMGGAGSQSLLGGIAPSLTGVTPTQPTP